MLPRLLCALMLLAAAQAYLLIDNSPLAPHAQVQFVAQQFFDRPGKPVVNVAMPLVVPPEAGTCSGTLRVTGAFRAVSQSGPIAPTWVVFSLGQGLRPPIAWGPALTRISWTLNSTLLGFDTALAAGGNSSNSFTFVLSLRLTPLAALPSSEVYWLSVHGVVADGNGTLDNRFYLRAMQGGTGHTDNVNALPASIRDAANVLGHNWTTWTRFETAAAALYSVEQYYDSSPRFAMRVEATNCSGEVNSPVHTPIPTPGASAPVLPSPDLVWSPSPEALATPSGNDSIIVPDGTKPLMATPMLIGIIVASAIVFGCMLLLAVLLARRMYLRRRHDRSRFGAREYVHMDESNGHGGIMPLSPGANGNTALHETGSDSGALPNRARTALPRTKSGVADPTEPWLKTSNGGVFTNLSVSAGDGATTPRGSKLIVDNDSDTALGNVTTLPRRGSVGSGSPRPRGKKRRTNSTGAKSNKVDSLEDS